jgi:hypothetical protein
MGIHQKTFDKKLAIFEKQIGAFMLAQSSVLPDDALSGGDGRFI